MPQTFGRALRILSIPQPWIGAELGGARTPRPGFRATQAGKIKDMSIWSWFKKKRSEQIEQRRNEAVAKAMARGATPEQAMAAGERAARGTTNTAVIGAINS
ncbi:hypothetical protein AB0J83_35960 [Actinoplanes sp. NPDC049596]|uniref:hypothetical protein n=1 Tax=unclassified Actinoplanes TaxID=2626549 RepID=UPI003440D560